MNIYNVNDFYYGILKTIAQSQEVSILRVYICVFEGEFSACLTNNGGCQDLCLLTSEGRVNCSCRGERKLLGDNTCVGEKDRLIHLL